MVVDETVEGNIAIKMDAGLEYIVEDHGAKETYCEYFVNNLYL